MSFVWIVIRWFGDSTKFVNLLCIRRTCPLVSILRNSWDEDIQIRGLNNSRTKSINSRHAITLFNFKDGPRYHQLSSIYLWYFVPWGGYTNSYYPLRILHYSFICLITYESGSGKPRFSFGHYNRSYPDTETSYEIFKLSDL